MEEVEEDGRKKGEGGRDGWQVTHDHVLQGALGQPAVEEHRDEDVPYGRPKDLRKTVGDFSCFKVPRT